MKKSDGFVGEIELLVVHQRSSAGSAPLSPGWPSALAVASREGFPPHSCPPRVGFWNRGRRCVASTLSACLLAFAAPAVTFTQSTVIAPSNTAYDGADIVVTNCTLTVDGLHSFASLQILGQARLTHSFAPSGVVLSNLVSVVAEQHILSATNATPLDTTTNVVMGSVAVRDASGVITYTNGVDYTVSLSNGLASIQILPGSAIADQSTNLVNYEALESMVTSGLNLAITGDAWVAEGGSINVDGVGYGGREGPGTGAIGIEPGPSGSGGGHGGVGGINSIAVQGGVANDSITQPTDKGSGGGAGLGRPGAAGGGAIRLTVGGTLRVDGVVSADGAVGDVIASGGGAGGSIWLTARTFEGSGRLSAEGGAGDPFYGGGGGGGRIALNYSLNTFSGAVFARGGTGYSLGGAGTTYTQGDPPSVGQVVVDNGGRAGAGTPIVATRAFDLTVQGAAAITLPNALEVRNLSLSSNSWLMVSNHELTVSGDATVAAGASITADSAGSPAEQGPGAGGTFSYYDVQVGGGGSFGGLGGFAGTSQFTGGGAYGSISAPANTGSGGGGSEGLGGAGGGTIRMQVAGTLVLNGRISANGGDGNGGGGGSGGSIWLTLGTLAGAGTISSDGGTSGGFGPYAGGGGGGGRISIQNQLNLFSGLISAYGGGGTYAGGAGTVFIQAAQPSRPSVNVDNGGQAGAVTPWPSSGVVGLGDLSVSGGARLTLGTSLILNNLRVSSGAWILTTNQGSISLLEMTVNSNLTVDAGGGILADGTVVGGSGIGRSGLSGGGGGGYGGSGGAGGGLYSGLGGFAYGSATEPTSGGSSGGAASDAPPGGAGGGGLHLAVLGNLTVDGWISADGEPGGGAGSGGGSGGGIWISAATLTGSGAIRANGGSGIGSGGGGGGGRIALQCSNNGFAGTLSAFGGAGSSSGGAGTIYTTASSFAAGQVILDNGGLVGSTPWTSSGNAIKLTVTGGAVVTLSMNEASFANLTVGSNSSIVLTGSQSLSCSSNLLIQAGGALLADGTGYAPGSGPGAGSLVYSGSAAASSGAGHGGNGASSWSSLSQPTPQPNGGATYDFLIPTQMGSGGGGPDNGGGAGGGVVILNVSGTLQVDGRLSANGMNGTNGGGGAGGSIALTVGTLSGSGVISANGGAGSQLSGGGGGGRISVQSTLNSFAGILSAFGGGGYAYGGAGTVYLLTKNQANGLFVADNGGNSGATTAWPGQFNLDWELRGSAIVNATSSSTVGNLLIESNSWLYCSNQFALNVSGNATIQAGAGIQTDGAGYRSGTGPGAGRYSYASGQGYLGGGGGHGGFGSSAGASTATSGGQGYGSTTTPIELGSGGAGNQGGGGAGGGALHIIVNGLLGLNGRISAEGAAGVYPGSGGGAGGSVWLSAGTLSGSGVISANGGPGNGAGGGGGGGRIAIQCANNYFLGAISAFGGKGISGWAGAGTIYTATNNQPLGQVLADNGGHPGTNTLVNATSPFDLVVSGGAVVSPPVSPLNVHNLRIASGGSVVGSGNESVLALVALGDVNVQAGGAMVVDGQGYPLGSGPGAGKASSGGASGGGYGGIGGASSTVSGGLSYGSAMQPLDFGSGGGGGFPFSPAVANGSAGGGALFLRVAGTLTIDGRLSASGAAAVNEASGGGSGGSIWLNAGVVAGSGTIAADGGAGYPAVGGGGAGGRVAVYSPADYFEGNVSVRGGPGYASGQDGLVLCLQPFADSGSDLSGTGQ